MRKLFYSLLAMAIVVGLTSSAHAAPKIIAAKFHADWCGSCKVIAPAYDEIVSKFSTSEVLFVVLDKTDDDTSYQAGLMAGALGIGEIFDANEKTGFVLLIDAETKEVKGKLTKTENAAQMTGMIEQVLAGESPIE